MQPAPQFNLMCEEGKKAVKLCNNKDCTKSAVMCQTESCNCHTHHKDNCMLVNIPLTRLIPSLNIKAGSYKQVLQNNLETCLGFQKLIDIKIQETKKSIDDVPTSLIGKERELYELIKNGSGNDLKGEMVSQVYESLHRQSKVDYTQRGKEVSGELDRIMKQAKRNFEDMKLFLSPEFSPLIFTRQLCGAPVWINDRTQLKMVSQDSANFHIAILQPPFGSQEKFARKFQFKVVINKAKRICFGICQKDSIVNLGFRWSAAFTSVQGNHFVCNGTLFQNGAQKDITQTPITPIEAGGIVQVTYDPVGKTVTFTNCAVNNQSVTSPLTISPQNKLSLCVGLFDNNDQIEYMGQVQEGTVTEQVQEGTA